jgi:hypothetical protein
MRWLALVRYRYLTQVRRAKWIVPFLAISILVAAATASYNPLQSDAWYRRQIADSMSLAGFCVIITYWFQVLILMMFCWSYGITPRRPEGARPSDLMDTAPVSGQLRFWGDAAGMTAAVLAIHLCTTPLLAYLIAVSPFPSALFFYLEIAIVVAVAFASTTASWTLRAETSRWGQTRATRSFGLFLLLMILVLLATVRVESFGLALERFLTEPSIRSWSGIVETVYSVPLLMALTLMVVGGFVTYYAIRSARAIEEG